MTTQALALNTITNLTLPANSWCSVQQNLGQRAVWYGGRQHKSGLKCALLWHIECISFEIPGTPPKKWKQVSRQCFGCKRLDNTQCPVTFLQVYLSLRLLLPVVLSLPACCKNKWITLLSPSKKHLDYMYKVSYSIICPNWHKNEKIPVSHQRCLLRETSKSTNGWRSSFHIGPLLFIKRL